MVVLSIMEMNSPPCMLSLVENDESSTIYSVLSVFGMSLA